MLDFWPPAIDAGRVIPTRAEAHPPVRPGSWLAVLVLAGGLFAAVVSTTVVGVALPTIGRDLHAGSAALSWIVDAYVLVYASLMIPGGVLGDRRGSKGVFVAGVGLFGIGALATGLAPTVPVLLLGRAIQGAGPAMLVPASLAVIRAAFADPGKRALAIGLWSTSSGLALAVGPVLGGLVVQEWGWRWVFLLNVPLAAVLVALAARCVARVDRSGATTRFDWPGALLSVVVVGTVTFGLIEARPRGWASTTVLGAFLLGAIAMAAFVGWERHRTGALIDVSLFAKPAFTVANAAAMAVFFAFVGSIVYFSAYFQLVQGRSPVDAGLDVSAIGVAVAVAAQIAGRLIGRTGPVPPMVAGLLISGFATIGLLRLGQDTGIGAIWWNLALVGAGVGLCLTPMTTIAVSAVDAGRVGMASAVHNALRQLGQALGVAVLGTLVYADLPANAPTGHLPADLGHRFVTGLAHANWVSAVALLAAAAATPLASRGPRAPAPPRTL